MKRCILTAVGLLIFVIRPSYAQGNEHIAMPEKVRNSLKMLVGTWNAKGVFEGKAEYKVTHLTSCRVKKKSL